MSTSAVISSTVSVTTIAHVLLYSKYSVKISTTLVDVDVVYNYVFLLSSCTIAFDKVLRPQYSFSALLLCLNTVMNVF
jgi:hypothetical protein